MSNNLFYSENREIRGGFLKPMFEICSKIDRTCGFCGKSYFNPQKQKNDDRLKNFVVLQVVMTLKFLHFQSVG
ncbi:MAG: hypothetical protein CM15mV56_160 [uncultured marine virus]|nr:MAG: hypothetical protein CM15mV56_160 [uncultured marine virus]